MQTPQKFSGLADRFALVLHDLRAALAARAPRDPAFTVLVLLVWPYLQRLAARFATLAARAPNLQPKPRRAATPRRHPRSTPSALPRHYGWLLLMVPAAGPLAGQLRALLAEAEVASLLDVAPQAGRILRPLCRALAIGPSPDLPRNLFPPRQPRPRPNDAAPIATAAEPPPGPPPRTERPRSQPQSPARPSSLAGPPVGLLSTA